MSKRKSKKTNSTSKKGEVTLDSLALAMAKGFEHIDSRFDNADGRLVGVEKRLERVEKRLGKAEGRIGKLDVKISKVETNLSAKIQKSKNVTPIKTMKKNVDTIARALSGRALSKKKADGIVNSDPFKRQRIAT